MAEIGFRDQTLTATMGTRCLVGGVGGRGRDSSPDSVIFALDSNFSLFSSASASVDRCSFASDVRDRDSLSADFSEHLAGQKSGGGGGGRESFSGPDLDLPQSNKLTVFHTANEYDNHCGKVERASKVEKQEDSKTLRIDHDDGGDDEGVVALNSVRNSFSQALRECQERRFRSEALTKKLERQRPASLDLNNSVTNLVSSSPRFGAMKKTAIISRKSGNFPSPGTPNCHHGSVGMDKGWSSERVPLQTGPNCRRQVGGPASLPFNNNQKTLPSKWEDAERWIFSPVGRDGIMRTSCQRHPLGKPKSKSGPLGPSGPSGTAYYSLYSPIVPMYDGNSVKNFIASSPFSTGVLMADGLAAQNMGKDRDFADRSSKPCITRCASVHGCKDLVCQSSGTSSQDEKVEIVKDAGNKVSQAVSRRDVATQMSPEGSCHSSPKRSSFSQSTPSILPIVGVHNCNSFKSEVRDVQVDERVTVTRWSKKHKSQIPSKGLDNVNDWKLKAVEAHSSTWAEREEAKIAAWENLQKAKAEAAIRKLEMKLEKERSSSMDKIMNKLRSAHKKVQEMRNSLSVNPTNQLCKTPSFKSLSFLRNWQMGSLSGCFSCRAF